MKDILPKALNQLISALEDIEKKFGIKYYLVGGILANIYSIFRITQDIDFVVDINSQNIDIKQYISILRTYNFVPMQDWEQAEIVASETKILQYFDQSERVKFDNYILDKFDRSKYKRIGPISLKKRVKETLFGIECWVASKEDFILSKLVFGGWQDFSDALGCWLRFKDYLDLTYLENTSRDLEIYKEYKLLKSGIEDPDEYFNILKGL